MTDPAIEPESGEPPVDVDRAIYEATARLRQENLELLRQLRDALDRIAILEAIDARTASLADS